jgi:hypothetical protein
MAMNPTSAAWPPLPLAAWRDTCTTLHLWTQIVGKTRLALAPPQNHWWQVALYLTARGLTTSPMACGARTFSVDFDFLDHLLIVRTDEGATRALPLIPRPVAQFHAEYMAVLRALGLQVYIMGRPVEVETAIPFAQDNEHYAYDGDAALRWWRVLSQSHRVLERFRGGFVGKSSPVHFFWGSFDLAVTRFSGRPAPRHPGGAPNCPDYVMVEAYSGECSSCGFWPGTGPVGEPAFYAYAYPEPAGYAQRRVRPDAAYYHQQMREFVLPYEAVRTASEPGEMLLQFAQSTYEAAADCAGWDRAALERGAFKVG